MPDRPPHPSRRAALGALAAGAIAVGLSACAASAPPRSAATRSAPPSRTPSPTPTPASPSPTPTPAAPSPPPTPAAPPASAAPASPALPTLPIDDPASDWVVVDKLRPLRPLNFVPPLAAIALVGQGGALRMRPAAAAAVGQLAAQFRTETGLALGSVSDYRSYSSQQRIYNRTRNDTLTARPGYSEHQTGLAIDFSSPAEGRTLQAAFGQTRTGQWLAANAWRWGFLMRYPDGLQPITGFQYEPWHFRYIGVPLATAMREKGVRTLEEWFGLPPAPNYPA